MNRGLFTIAKNILEETMRLLLLVFTLLLGLSAFSVAYAETYTKEKIVGNWQETGDNKASWQFKENGTITCLGKCNYKEIPQAYEVDGGTITLIWTKVGRRVHICDMVGPMLQIGKYQFSRI